MKLSLSFNAIALLVGVLVSLTIPCCGDSVSVIDLKKDWKLTNQNETIKFTNLKLPSGVYSVLYGEEVLKSYNDINMRWIAYDNWTYSLEFNFNLKKDDLVNLTLHGVDTVSEISLNGNFLGRTDNMFVRYTYDVTKMLQEEDNYLQIKFTSPVYAANASAAALLERNITVPPNCPPKPYHGECNMNKLRKMQASFSWDWGLAAPSMGIWKPVTLELYKIALIRDIDVAISKNDTHWIMHNRVFIDANGKQDFYATLVFYAVELLENAIIIDKYKKQPINGQAPVIEFEQAIPIENVELWWPNGSGAQKLYPLHFTLNAWCDVDGPNLRNRTRSEKSIRIGFRTIELVEETAPAGDGNTFLFKVNGQEIFMKGSNYIPSHILPELSDDQKRTKHLLQAAKEANMNMLRVWGGGIYESDYFYDLADQYGILIWQDMMFACAMYPATDNFLQSVRTEVMQQARRLSRHTSVAIFVTNNENEVALVQNWYNTFHERVRFEDEYRRLYVSTVRDELKSVDKTARPLPLISSPSNGKESEKEFYISEDPQDAHFGDVHFYSYFADAWNPINYPRPRFASEYGFQSLPQMDSWLRSKGAEDDLLDLMYHRQHHPYGMLPIKSLIYRHLPLPLPESPEYMEAFVYFSQIVQAMGIKVETELYRSLRDTDHRTMGALYWQLNDVWVAPSWSSIDFYGNYKLLHYWAKDFLAPISIIALYDESKKSVNISLTCDYMEVNTTDLQVKANIYLWSELFPENSTSWPVTLKPNGVHYDKVIPIKDLFEENKFTKNNAFIEFLLEQNSKILSKTYYFPCAISAAYGVQDPKITVEISDLKYCQHHDSTAMNSYSILVTVEKPAIFVFIEITHPSIKHYKLSKNGYMQLTPAEVVHLEFENEKCISLKKKYIKILTVNQYMS